MNILQGLYWTNIFSMTCRLDISCQTTDTAEDTVRMATMYREAFWKMEAVPKSVSLQWTPM